MDANVALAIGKNSNKPHERLQRRAVHMLRLTCDASNATATCSNVGRTRSSFCRPTQTQTQTQTQMQTSTQSLPFAAHFGERTCERCKLFRLQPNGRLAKVVRTISVRPNALLCGFASFEFASARGAHLASVARRDSSDHCDLQPTLMHAKAKRCLRANSDSDSTRR